MSSCFGVCYSCSTKFTINNKLESGLQNIPLYTDIPINRSNIFPNFSSLLFLFFVIGPDSVKMGPIVTTGPIVITGTMDSSAVGPDKVLVIAGPMD